MTNHTHLFGREARFARGGSLRADGFSSILRGAERLDAVEAGVVMCQHRPCVGSVHGDPVEPAPPAKRKGGFPG